MFSFFYRNVWATPAMVLPSAEVLLVRQWACRDLGLAMVWRWGCQAQCDGGRSGLCDGSAENWCEQKIKLSTVLTYTLFVKMLVVSTSLCR